MSAEFHDMTELPAVDNDARMPADERMPVEETVPTEEKYSFDEFNVRSAPRRESEERHVSLKKLFLKPVAALILVGAVVVASLGIDPLSMAADTIEAKRPVIAGSGQCFRCSVFRIGVVCALHSRHQMVFKIQMKSPELVD